MKRSSFITLFAALAVLTMPANAPAAVVTTKYALTSTGWTDLGAGPLTLGPAGLIVFAIGDTTPLIPLHEGMTVLSDDVIDVNTPSHVWAMNAGTAGASVYTAPVVLGAGGAATSVWSAADAAANGMTLTNGGLTVTPTGHTWTSIRATNSQSTGKYYVEFKTSAAVTVNTQMFGLADASFNAASYLGTSGYSFGTFPAGIFMWNFTGYSGTPSPNPASGDVWAIAIDFAGGNVWLAQNNVWLVGIGGSAGAPAAGTFPYATFNPGAFAPMFPALSFDDPGGGVWTLQPTAASQKYAPPAGFTAWDGAGAATGCSQATAYLARATGETAHAADLTTLICGLVTDGVWAKLDALYVLAQQTAGDSLLNLIGTNYNATNVGGAAFTAYRGYSFSALTKYLDTNFNQRAATSPQFTQNSASLGIWSDALVNDTACEIGNIGGVGAGDSAIFDDFGGTFYARMNDGSGGSVTTPGTAGLYAGDRSSSANSIPYWNGIAQTTVASTSSLPTNSDIVVNAANAPTGQTLSEAHIGASLGASGQLALYNRLRTYMTAVGVP